MNKSGKDRLNVVNLILVRCWEYIEEFCEICKKRQEDAAAAGSSAGIGETMAEILKSIAGGSEMGEGSSTPVPEASGGSETSATAGARAKTQEEAEENKDEEAPEEEDGSSPQTETENDENSSESGEAASEPSEESEGSFHDSGSKSEKQETTENESGRIPYQQTESLSEPLGGTTERNESYERKHYDRAAADIERMLDKMAERAACEQLENERIQELNDVAQNISYGNIHAGVSIQINRISSVDEELMEQYDMISAPLINISRQLQKTARCFIRTAFRMKSRNWQWDCCWMNQDRCVPVTEVPMQERPRLFCMISARALIFR